MNGRLLGTEGRTGAGGPPDHLDIFFPISMSGDFSPA